MENKGWFVGYFLNKVSKFLKFQLYDVTRLDFQNPFVNIEKKIYLKNGFLESFHYVLNEIKKKNIICWCLSPMESHLFYLLNLQYRIKKHPCHSCCRQGTFLHTYLLNYIGQSYIMFDPGDWKMYVFDNSIAKLVTVWWQKRSSTKIHNVFDKQG